MVTARGNTPVGTTVLIALMVAEEGGGPRSVTLNIVLYVLTYVGRHVRSIYL
jgi:hypothetical protein